VSRLRTERLSLFHSLTVAETKESLVKDSLQNGVKILLNASCNCGATCKNSHHFFFDCDKYTDSREILFNNLNWLNSNINIDVNLLTKGYDLHDYMYIQKHRFRQYTKKKKKEKRYFWRCVLVL
jgi:hypothetical protein